MILSQADVVERLREAVDRAGTIRAFARSAGISDIYVGLVLRNKAAPGAAILRALRIEKLPPQYDGSPPGKLREDE